MKSTSWPRSGRRSLTRPIAPSCLFITSRRGQCQATQSAFSVAPLALIDASRAAVTLTTMSADEAQRPEHR